MAILIWTLSLAALLIDLAIYYLRFKREVHSVVWRITFIALAIISDLSLLVFSVGSFSLLNDNPTIVLTIGMWTFTLFIVTVVPRWAFYIFYFTSRHRAVRGIGLLIASVVLGVFVYGAVKGRRDYIVNHIDITSPRVPTQFVGFRIAQFSDLHIGSMLNPMSEIQNIVELINTLDADLVVFSGDLVNIRHSELDSQTMSILSRLKARNGVISTIGNHDVGIYIKDTIKLPKAENISELKRKEISMGWQLLDDTTIYIKRGADSISISGISFDPALNDFRHTIYLPDINLSKVYNSSNDSTFNITVSHMPQLWSNIKQSRRGDLTLAGHVHSMQLKIHLFGHAFSPAQLLYKEWSGLYDDADRYLYINDGIGYVGFPIRLGTRPEITLFELKR